LTPDGTATETVLPLWVNEPWTVLVALAIVCAAEKVVPGVVSVPDNAGPIGGPGVGPDGVTVWPAMNVSAVKGMQVLPVLPQEIPFMTCGADSRSVPATVTLQLDPSARLLV
jgi:hypothetical protein